MTDEYETVEDYYENWDESAGAVTRYEQYSAGKVEAVEDLDLLDGGPDRDPNDYRQERLREVRENPNTRQAAEAKGAADAVEELFEHGLIEEEVEIETDETDEEPAGLTEDGDGEDDTETVASTEATGGVEIDADEFE